MLLEQTRSAWFATYEATVLCSVAGVVASAVTAGGPAGTSGDGGGRRSWCQPECMGWFTWAIGPPAAWLLAWGLLVCGRALEDRLLDFDVEERRDRAVSVPWTLPLAAVHAAGWYVIATAILGHAQGSAG